MKTIDLELEVLKGLVIDNSLINQVSLSESDFSQQTNQIIFGAIQTILSGGGIADLITIAEHIEKQYRTVDMDYLADMIENTWGSAANTVKYSQMLQAEARKRKAKDIAFGLQMNLEENGPFDPVQFAIQELMKLDVSDSKHEHTFKDAARRATERTQEAFDKKGILGITTGLTELDEALGGYVDTDLIVIPARPAMGKTAFLLSCLRKCGVEAGLISSEQDATQVGLRLISQHGRVNSQNVRAATLSEQEWDRFSIGAIKTSEMLGVINDNPSINITEVISTARKWKHHRDIKILYVDYIQRIKGSNPKATRVEQVTEVVSALKSLARELQIPVVALAQLNRKCEDRTDKRPMTSDIADASEIEKEADVIMTLYRDEVYDPDSPDKGIAEINVVKNRHGPIGVIRAQFIGKYFQFEDFTPVREMASYRG